MSQIHYIEKEEEITSLVDRLRKSKSSENFFVIPPRSVVFQGLVNLKLFKREAQKIRKKVCLITQDALIISLAKKAGVETRESIENLKISEEKKALIRKDLEIKGHSESEIEKKRRLENIGTSDFYNNTLTLENTFKYPLQKSEPINFPKKMFVKEESEENLKKFPETGAGMTKMEDVVTSYEKKSEGINNVSQKEDFFTDFSKSNQKKVEDFFKQEIETDKSLSSHNIQTFSVKKHYKFQKK